MLIQIQIQLIQERDGFLGKQLLLNVTNLDNTNTNTNTNTNNTLERWHFWKTRAAKDR